MEDSFSNEGSQRELSLRGRLAFTDHDAFRDIVAQLGQPGPSTCSVNLSGLEAIDSAGLGLLMLVNDAAKENHISVTLRGARDQVKRMLELTMITEVIAVAD